MLEDILMDSPPGSRGPHNSQKPVRGSAEHRPEQPLAAAARQGSGWVSEAPVVQIKVIRHYSLASTQRWESSSEAQQILFLLTSLRKAALCTSPPQAPVSQHLPE